MHLFLLFLSLHCSFMLSPVKKTPNKPRDKDLCYQHFTLFLSYIFPPFLQSVRIKQPISKKTFVLMGSSLLSSIPGKSIKGAAVNLTAEVGSIQIRNGSIMITCDGLYLLSLKGNIFFHGPKEEDLLNLTLWKTDNKTSRALWEQTVWVSGDAVNLTIVLYLFAQDNITLGTSSNAKESHLSLAHIQRNPGFLYLLDSIHI
uniref:TNF family profile domain-containing protein n=1 Tax=Aquila chrysaetos chrysaetos TaxID=223781 RepID=A0A663DLY2_AQUCH